MNNRTEQVKAAIIGREREVMIDVGGVSAEILDGRHHPCPKCGGTDRFRWDVGKHFAICNQCFAERNGDVLAAVAWMRTCTFPESVKLVAEYLAVNQQSKPPSVTPSKLKGRPYANLDAAIAAIDRHMAREQGVRVGKWPYVDAGGDNVACVVRYDMPPQNGQKQPKTFRPVTKHADGWRLSDPPGKWPLYRLPELTGGNRVYIVEGEKAADAAFSIGLTATTSAHGSKSPHKTDWSPLAGRQYVLLPDNDEPGRKYAEAVTAILASLKPPATGRTVALPELSAGGDIVDWLNAHDAAEPKTLRERIEGLPGIDDEKPPILAPVGIADLITGNPNLAEPIIDGILRRGETANIIAPSKTGKSWLVYNIALSMATGWPLFDHFETKCGRVLLIDNELREPTLAKRIPQVADALGIRLKDYDGYFDVLALRGKCVDLYDLLKLLERKSLKQYDVILADAWYRFLP